MNQFSRWNAIKIATEHRQRPDFKEREIFFARLGQNIGHEQAGVGDVFSRPILVLKKFNTSIFWGIPLSRTKNRGRYYYPFPVKGLGMSVAIISQLRLFDAKRLERKIGSISQTDFIALKRKIIPLLEDDLFFALTKSEGDPEGVCTNSV